VEHKGQRDRSRRMSSRRGGGGWWGVVSRGGQEGEIEIELRGL